MARGGARPGAGRKPGATTKKTREIADRAAAEGVTPLEYMLTILRDDEQPPAMRFEAAKAAAPFVHPKLSNIEARVDADVSLSPNVVQFIAPGTDADSED
ncbi:MAG: hypothetical protein V7672_00770 [Brevundimonas sp.]|uniref:hypothetical protein n=1 Tax=Brevundimonas sp. TaxID=1871086 RepID=UPI00300341B9